MSAVLSTAQTGVGDSQIVHTNFAQDRTGPGAIVITSTVGATPTVTVNIQGSIDGVTWFQLPYALAATPTTFVTTAITITTATTNIYILSAPAQPSPYVFVKLALSANTNVTLTAGYYV